MIGHAGVQLNCTFICYFFPNKRTLGEGFRFSMRVWAPSREGFLSCVIQGWPHSKTDLFILEFPISLGGRLHPQPGRPGAKFLLFPGGHLCSSGPVARRDCFSYEVVCGPYLWGTFLRLITWIVAKTGNKEVKAQHAGKRSAQERHLGPITHCSSFPDLFLGSCDCKVLEEQMNRARSIKQKPWWCLWK